MLVQDLINQINIDSNDLPDSDAETMQYINYAIDSLSFLLCGLKDPEMMAVCDIAPGLLVPSNFVEFVPQNGYPVYNVGDRFNTTTGNVVKLVKFTTSKPHISLVTDTIPFKDIYAGVLCQFVSKLIKGKSNFPKDITAGADENLQMLMDLIKAAKAVS